jgi:exodeoxyribonuclease V alpha subunit
MTTSATTQTFLPLLRQAHRQGELRALDLHTGLFLMERCGGDQLVLLAGTLTSAATGLGNTCLPLAELTTLFPWLEPADASEPAMLPDAEELRGALLASPAVAGPGEQAPLILDENDRLYLYRYFAAEQRVAADLAARAGQRLHPDPDQAASRLALLFPDRTTEPDLQKIAVALAQLAGLTILSGGPGTGKTWTAARILRLAAALARQPLNMALAAPTGKAAARLDESIRNSAADIGLVPLATLPEAKTLHRLLGCRPDDDSFRHNSANPLDLDLLLVDEASMIDLILMDNLLAALPPSCRLILLGDHNQLASVEAGSLFGDLCRNAQSGFCKELAGQLERLTGSAVPVVEPAPTLVSDAVVSLQKSYRFDDRSGIGHLAAAIRQGKTTIMDAWQEPPWPDLVIHEPASARGENWLREQIVSGYGPLLKAGTIREAFTALDRFRILCGVRRGSLGVAGMNALCRDTLVREGLLEGHAGPVRGTVVIITRNNYHLGLFNGDICIHWPDGQGRLMAWFMGADNRLHALAPARLPAHDPAWAITVHKAQGSEFDRILFVLPPADSRVLSRELLYTAVTRAKKELALFGDRQLLARAMTCPIRRFSGLAGMLGHSETKSFAKRRFSGTT